MQAGDHSQPLSSETQQASQPPWSRDQATELVAAWQASGKRLATWCREQGVIPHRLKYWSDRLSELARRESVDDQPAGLIPVLRQVDDHASITVILGANIRLEVRHGCDLAFLRAVVEVLR